MGVVGWQGVGDTHRLQLYPIRLDVNRESIEYCAL